MKHESAVSKTLDLPGGTLVPFASSPGERVRVLYGRVWLTEEGDPRDAFLVSGEEVALGGRGLAVIEAFTPARVQIFESRSLWHTVRQGAQRAVQWLTDLSLEPTRRPVAASAMDLKLAQALAEFDGSLGLVQRVEVQAGCPGRNQALA